MVKKLDQVLVIDIEATCWETEVPPEGQESEIIEIGICMLDIHKMKPVTKESLIIKPQRSKVSSFCTELTTLTQAQVDKGIRFNQACKILRDQYSSLRRVWASYGNMDRRFFERQSLAQSIRYPLGTTHINVKSLLALMYKLPHEIGFAKALKLCGIEPEGTHHRGVDDAWNTALILAKLLERTGTNMVSN